MTGQLSDQALLLLKTGNRKHNHVSESDLENIHRNSILQYLH